MAKAEGKLFEMLDPSAVRTDFLEPFDFNEPKEKVRVVTKEFSAVCPFSGLPDVAEVILEYHPDGGKCVELKSLKYYYTSFRPVGLYQEGVTKRIYEDLKALLGTERIQVTTIYNTRGGFDTTCVLGSLG